MYACMCEPCVLSSDPWSEAFIFGWSAVADAMEKEEEGRIMSLNTGEKAKRESHGESQMVGSNDVVLERDDGPSQITY